MTEAGENLREMAQAIEIKSKKIRNDRRGTRQKIRRVKRRLFLSNKYRRLHAWMRSRIARRGTLPT
ncbi:MAG: hypothetical protein IJ566_02515 [Cardiobacteriaceae bacterium]|nr:hypothetical protein [Cardiobacteriaceae bacterium]